MEIRCLKGPVYLVWTLGIQDFGGKSTGDGYYAVTINRPGGKKLSRPEYTPGSLSMKRSRLFTRRNPHSEGVHAYPDERAFIQFMDSGRNLEIDLFTRPIRQWGYLEVTIPKLNPSVKNWSGVCLWVPGAHSPDQGLQRHRPRRKSQSRSFYMAIAATATARSKRIRYRRTAPITFFRWTSPRPGGSVLPGP